MPGIKRQFAPVLLGKWHASVQMQVFRDRNKLVAEVRDSAHLFFAPVRVIMNEFSRAVHQPASRDSDSESQKSSDNHYGRGPDNGLRLPAVDYPEIPLYPPGSALALAWRPANRQSSRPDPPRQGQRPAWSAGPRDSGKDCSA